jgi:hypothetical protein
MTRRFDAGQVWSAYSADLKLWFRFRLVTRIKVRRRTVWIAEKLWEVGPLQPFDVVAFNGRGQSLIEDLTGPTYVLKERIK